MGPNVKILMGQSFGSWTHGHSPSARPPPPGRRRPPPMGKGKVLRIIPQRAQRMPTLHRVWVRCGPSMVRVKSR